MKRRILGLLCSALCFVAWAGDELHTFTDTQGRTIQLKVIKCDFEHDKVIVDRQDGRRLNVNISDFCAGDREYLQQWFIAKELLSEENLKIVCDDKVTDKRREIVTAMQASSSGNQL